jgi:hypothetical protein
MKGYFFPLLLTILFTLCIIYLSLFDQKLFQVSAVDGSRSSKEILLQQRHRHIIPSQDQEILESIHEDMNRQDNPLAVTPRDGTISSPYAYITLLHGIDDSFKYRGYLYNIMIMKTALQSLGSTADFIVMIGFTNDDHHELFQTDLDRLTVIGIQILLLPRFLHTPNVNFAEMALLKITPWSLTKYQKIQFFDGDLMPIVNMDCYFKLNQNTFNVGNASPLNSGWYLAIPNEKDYESLKRMAMKRLNEPWDRTQGWGEIIPSWLTNSQGKSFRDWNFNGASLDQGLLTHHFVINEGRVVLINRKVVTQYNGLMKPSALVSDLLSCCQSRLPTSAFVHFTGKTKPWLNEITESSRRDVKIWGRYLNQLKIDGVNSSNIHEQGLKPPLGYFHPNTR